MCDSPKTVDVVLSGLSIFSEQAAATGYLGTKNWLKGMEGDRQIYLPLNFIRIGSNYYERIGRVTWTYKIEYDLNITFVWRPMEPLDNGKMPIKVKMVIVHDKAPNGAYPKFESVFQSRRNDGSLTGDYDYRFQNVGTEDRFSILEQRDVEFNPRLPLWAVNYFTPMNPFGTSEACVQKIRGCVHTDVLTNYQTEGTGIQSISTGALYIAFLANSSDTSVISQLSDMSFRSVPIDHMVNGIVRLTFKDIY